MNISVFGLGYVGVVSATCLARDGHQVIGVDVNPDKVDIIRAGDAPIVEPGLSDLLRDVVGSGALTATDDVEGAVGGSDVSLVSVGTPSQPSGATDLSFVHRVCEEIGAAASAKGSGHTVVLRSTVPPGTTADLEARFEKMGVGDLVHLAFNPEFLREASAIDDYDAPPYTVIGTGDPVAEEAVRAMYATVRAPVYVVESGVAELVKVVSNTWHATKVSFANEIGRVARAYGLDGAQVMELMAQDEKLNVSPAYLRPGGAYGGSCLPKDVRGLAASARSRMVPVPLVDAIQESNRVQIELGVEAVMRTGCRRVAVFGLAFKPKTDDLRESPAVLLVKRLVGEGRFVTIYDAHVHQATLMGTNLEYLRRHLPHFESMLSATPEEALREADLAVVTQSDAALLESARVVSNGVPLLDLSTALTRPGTLHVAS